MAVLHNRAFVVNILGILCYHICANVAHDFEHTVIAVHCVVEILGRVVKLVSVGEVSLFELHNLFHHGMAEMVFKRVIVIIEVSHYFEFFL